LLLVSECVWSTQGSFSFLAFMNVSSGATTVFKYVFVKK